MIKTLRFLSILAAKISTKTTMLFSVPIATNGAIKKCNLIDKKHYKLHQLNPNLQFFCTKCKEDNFPFIKLNEFEFLTFINDNEEAINDLKPQKLLFRDK